MSKPLLLLAVSFVIASTSIGQLLDSIRLSDADIPAGYTKSDKLVCNTPHACSFYEQIDLYESMFGKVTRKEFQSFEKKGDRGTILYFEFEKEFMGDAFLSGLLWGQNSKPTKSEPDDFYSKGKILIIWGFNLKSEIKEISKTKVTSFLK